MSQKFDYAFGAQFSKTFGFNFVCMRSFGTQIHSTWGTRGKRPFWQFGVSCFSVFLCHHALCLLQFCTSIIARHMLLHSTGLGPREGSVANSEI